MISLARRLTLGLPGGARWVLLVLLALLVIVAAIVSLAPAPTEPAAHPTIRKTAPAALAGDLSDLAFLRLDAMLERVSVDGRGNLVVDAATTAALEIAVAELPGPPAPATTARARFLVQKGLPGPAGEQLADLMMRYQRYLVAVRDLGLAGSTPPDRDAYQTLTRLQAEHFGADDARLLFSDRNALMRAMLGVNQ